jgi:type I restriction enzyme S subunit
MWLDELGERWDLKGAQATIFKREHSDFVAFGNFIEDKAVAVRASQEPDKEWPVYGVSNQDGIFFSHLQLGSSFRVPYRGIQRDWFFHNPTRANVGSLGRVPEVSADALTSPEYQVWGIRDAIWLPEYVEALIKMPFFNLLIQVHRVGAVKERLYTRNLMEIPVPDRDLHFQELLIAKWRALQKKVSEAEARIVVHEEALVADVLRSSGIVINISPSRERAFGMMLDEFDRWGVTFNRETWTLQDILASELFRRVPLQSIARVNPPRTRETPPHSLVSFVPMDAVSQTSGTIEDAEELLIEGVSKGYTAFEEGDLLWAKITPCMQNGKSAVARDLKNGVGFGSTEFHVIRPVDPKQTLTEYLWVLLRLSSIRQAAKRYFVGSAGQQRVPQDFLEELVIPLPSIEIQRSIVDGVLAKRLLVEQERRGLSALRAASIRDIEANIISGNFEGRPSGV